MNTNYIFDGACETAHGAGSLTDTIINGDCLEVLAALPPDSVDLIMTSPPYAEKRKKAYGGIPADKYVEWFLPRAEQFKRVLKPTGSFILNIKESCQDGERQTYVLELVLALRKQGWRWVEEYIWNKTNPFPTGSQRRLKDGFERCFHFAKSKDFLFFPDEMKVKSSSEYVDQNRRRKNQGAHTTNNGSGMRMSKRVTDDMVRPSTVITLACSCINIGHPAAFPSALPAFFIGLMTKPGDTVLDPFNGGGTTTLAAKKLGRHWIGVELAAPYCLLARERLGAYVQVYESHIALPAHDKHGPQARESVPRVEAGYEPAGSEAEDGYGVTVF